MIWLLLAAVAVLMYAIARLWIFVFDGEKSEQQAEPCPACGRPGCNGSLAQCPGRWEQ